MHYTNSKKFLLHYQEIVAVLKGAVSNTRAASLLANISTNSDLLRLSSAAIVMFWTVVVKPFHSTCSRQVVFDEALTSLQEAGRRVDIVNMSTTPFESLRAQFKETCGNSEATSAVQTVEQLWMSSSDAVRKSVDKVVQGGFLKAKEKMIRDFEVIAEGVKDAGLRADRMYPMTNAGQERAFGQLKYSAARYLTMARDNLGSSSLAKLNDLSAWLTRIDPARCSELGQLIKNGKKDVSKKRKLNESVKKL